MRLIKRLNDSDFFGGVPTFVNNITRNSSRGLLLDNKLNVAMMYMTKHDVYKLPGGGLEEGETKEEAFLREIKEETGYDAEIIGNLGYIEEHKNRNEFRQHSYCFMAKTLKTKTEVLLTEDERITGLTLHWMTMEKALMLMNNSLGNCDEYSMNFMIIRDKIILEEGVKKLSLVSTVD